MIINMRCPSRHSIRPTTKAQGQPPCDWNFVQWLPIGNPLRDVAGFCFRWHFTPKHNSQSNCASKCHVLVNSIELNHCIVYFFQFNNQWSRCLDPGPVSSKLAERTSCPSFVVCLSTPSLPRLPVARCRRKHLDPVWIGGSDGCG